MTDTDQKNHEEANRNNGLMAIRSDYCPPENLRTFAKKIHVTARWLSARFKITYPLILHVIDAIEVEQSVNFLRDGGNVWVDDHEFVEICNHPSLSHSFDEAARGAVLQLLGHYRDMRSAT